MAKLTLKFNRKSSLSALFFLLHDTFAHTELSGSFDLPARTAVITGDREVLEILLEELETDNIRLTSSIEE